MWERFFPTLLPTVAGFVELFTCTGVADVTVVAAAAMATALDDPAEIGFSLTVAVLLSLLSVFWLTVLRTASGFDRLIPWMERFPGRTTFGKSTEEGGGLLPRGMAAHRIW